MSYVRSTRIFKLWEKYEHHLGLGAVFMGFAFDFFMAQRPDTLANNLLLISYLFITATIIVLLNVRARKLGDTEPLLLLLILQFCFGGLASNLLILYGRSGTLAGSAVFIGLLVALVFSNEYLRNKYAQLRLNIGIFYVLLLSYLVIAVPTFLTHAIGTKTFLLSVLLSLVIMVPFFIALHFAVARGVREGHLLWEARLIVACVAIFFSGLYFLQIIPPVPLSLKSIGVYHSVLKQGDSSYSATHEAPAWFVFWRDTAATFTVVRTGETVYCFSSVFAPAELRTPVYHRFEYKNPITNEWSTQGRVSFDISGGRDEGYRGFSIKTNITAGDWRCDVETASGALIGRISFTVVQTSTAPTLSQAVL